jgi:hypothetical protein
VTTLASLPCLTPTPTTTTTTTSSGSCVAAVSSRWSSMLLLLDG